MINKLQLRRLMNDTLENIPDRLLRSVQLWADLSETAEYREAGRVMAFVSIRTEVDTAGLLARLDLDGKTVLLPRTEADGIVAVQDAKGWTTGAFGIKEPLGPPVDPRSIDLIIVPGLAFTTDGKRLGRGRGHYDRFLPGTAAPTIGVCFTEQLVDEVPMEPHDVQLDRVMSA